MQLVLEYFEFFTAGLCSFCIVVDSSADPILSEAFIPFLLLFWKHSVVYSFTHSCIKSFSLSLSLSLSCSLINQSTNLLIYQPTHSSIICQTTLTRSFIHSFIHSFCLSLKLFKARQQFFTNTPPVVAS